jgi:DNA polymerase (family 10)
MQDIRGDLHIKADIGDIEKFAKACIKRGYSYIAIVADIKNANSYFKRIDSLNKAFKNFKILKSIEVNILKDGSLDAPDNILKKADIVYAAVNSYFNLGKSEQTKRLINAVKNPFVNILAHPTCRILGEREPISFDFKELIETSKKSNVYFEVDARANRADLPDYMIKEAKDRGAKFSISSNASTIEELSVIKYGLFQARRGWLERTDVINTKSLQILLSSLF